MKKTKTLLFYGFLFVITFNKFLVAQYTIRPHSLSISGIMRTAPNELIFSIYFKNTASDSAIEYSGGQFHIDFNKSILNGGTGTLSIISSGLPSSVQSTNPTVYTVSTPGQLRLAPKAPPGALAGGFLVNPGDSVLVAKLSLTTSAAEFSSWTSHNLSWRKAPDANPITKVSGYIWQSNQILSSQTSYFIYPSSSKELQITALIEGFYESGIMIPDTVKIELHSSSYPFSLVDEAETVLSSNGEAIANFFSAAEATNYYIVVKHRNSIETWSSSTPSFSGGLMSYNFTDNINKAYGDNLKLKSGKYCIFSGDIIPQDGLIDLSDVISVINDGNSFLIGEALPTDLNGDQLVDLADIILVINNANAFVSKQSPETLLFMKQKNNTIENLKNKIN